MPICPRSVILDESYAKTANQVLPMRNVRF